MFIVKKHQLMLGIAQLLIAFTEDLAGVIYQKIRSLTNFLFLFLQVTQKLF